MLLNNILYVSIAICIYSIKLCFIVATCYVFANVVI